jgi:glutaredoxin
MLSLGTIFSIDLQYFFKAIMKITFYRSALCPRCLYTRRILLDIIRGNKEIELEEIDILAHPLKSWMDGIRIFPALKINDRILSGVFLGREKIKAFIHI